MVPILYTVKEFAMPSTIQSLDCTMALSKMIKTMKWLLPHVGVIIECTQHKHLQNTAYRPRWTWCLQLHQIWGNSPLTIIEIAKVQQDDPVLQKLSKNDKYSIQLVKNTKVLCKNKKMLFLLFAIGQLAGITTICSALVQHVLKKPFALHYLERYALWPLIICWKL